jgi:hypothetical protein
MTDQPDLIHIWPPPPTRPRTPASSWTAWTLAAVGSIWTAVVLISVFSPDMIHGSEHQRMPVAAFGAWVWGFGASLAAVAAMARLRGSVARRPLWMMMAGATAAIWCAATVVSVFGPTQVTGTDPTTIPLAALIAPIVAMLATIGAATVVLAADGLRGTFRDVD